MSTAPRTFQHIIAGAGTVMPDGERIVFGGAPGGVGFFVTEDKEKIEFLEKLSKMPASQVTEVIHTAEGRDVAVVDPTFKEDLQTAVADSRANSAREIDPAIAAARANLAKNIAQNSN